MLYYAGITTIILLCVLLCVTFRRKRVSVDFWWNGFIMFGPIVRMQTLQLLTNNFIKYHRNSVIKGFILTPYFHETFCLLRIFGFFGVLFKATTSIKIIIETSKLIIIIISGYKNLFKYTDMFIELN